MINWLLTKSFGGKVFPLVEENRSRRFELFVFIDRWLYKTIASGLIVSVDRRNTLLKQSNKAYLGLGFFTSGPMTAEVA